ncbi:MAG TPA: metallophosphoesterase [Candidatus Dormibacteraeota bacterium]
MPEPEPGAKLEVLIVGDVHGDIERLFEALKPYPADRWHTIFLGDVLDGGDFGVGALRYARDRLNTSVLIGNHEVLTLWALREPKLLSLWASVGGKPHELEELGKDQPLQRWLMERPLLLKLDDGTLVQHSDTDLYARLLGDRVSDPIAQVNQAGRAVLEHGGHAELWDILAPGRMFRQSRTRLELWLEKTGSRRLVHGHVPHGKNTPDAYHEGLAICFDGGLSRFYGSRYRRRSPLGASVAPLA